MWKLLLNLLLIGSGAHANTVIKLRNKVTNEHELSVAYETNRLFGSTVISLHWGKIWRQVQNIRNATPEGYASPGITPTTHETPAQRHAREWDEAARKAGGPEQGNWVD